MLRTFIPLNSLDLDKKESNSTHQSEAITPNVLRKNRALVAKKGYGYEKKLPMHFIASLEHELKIPEAEPTNVLSSKETLST